MKNELSFIQVQGDEFETRIFGEHNEIITMVVSAMLDNDDIRDLITEAMATFIQNDETTKKLFVEHNKNKLRRTDIN